MDHELQHGIIHRQQVQQCVHHKQGHVMMEHYDEVIQIVAVHKSIELVIHQHVEQYLIETLVRHTYRMFIRNVNL